MDEQFLDALTDGVQTFRDAAQGHDPDAFDEAEQEFDAVLKQARERGMTRINEGGGRVVYRGGTVAGDNHVVKIEKGGADENRDAVTTWQAMDADARECVASIVAWASDYRWLVQRKAGAGTPGSTQEMLERLADEGWGLVDGNLENVGTLDGRPVVIDLGRLYPI
jgi:hypothetical protein